MAVAPLALAAAGCGFHLRGQGSYGFSSVFVTAPSSPPLEAELRRTISGGEGTTLADAATNAQVVLTVSAVSEDKSVLSLSSGGRVREFALTKRVVFRLADKDGREWIPSQEIVVRRTYLYDDTQRLAREIQENRLLREMQTDAVQQIVRQMMSAKAPG